MFKEPKERFFVRKNLSKVPLKVALVYPNLYKGASSSLGYQLVYFLLNSYGEVACERATLDYPLTIESKLSLRKFDVVAFSLYYELDYVNVLKILAKSGIPLKRSKRNKPLVVAGGPCTVNPYPLAKYMDAFVIGCFEAVADKLIKILLERAEEKKSCLETLASVPGVFVPEFENEVYLQRVTNLDTSFYPVPQVLSSEGPFSSCFMLELSRGCSWGCNFCLLGYTQRPRRDRSLNKLIKLLEEAKRYGYEKVAFISSDFLGHPNAVEIANKALEMGFSISLPSLRADKVDDKLLEVLERGLVKTVTVAPETASRKLKRVIGKEIENEAILKLARALPKTVSTLKLYFMAGLPGETKEDVKQNLEFISKIYKDFKERNPRREVVVSVNPFIPKPHTPFQYCSFFNLERLKAIYNMYKNLRAPGLFIKLLHLKRAFIQAILSLGGPDVSNVLGRIFEAGLTPSVWFKAFDLMPETVKRVKEGCNPEDRLPWEKIRTGVSTEYIRLRFEKAMEKLREN